MSKKGEITQNIISKMDNLADKLKSEKTEIIKELQTAIDNSWDAYTLEKNKFQTLKTTTNFQKINEVKALEDQLALMKQKIDAVNKEVGTLSKVFATKQNITIKVPNVDTSVSEEITFVSNEIKRLNGEPCSISSDKELDEEIALIKEQHKLYEAQKAIFKKHVEDYKKKHGEDSLGNNKKGPADEKIAIQELGKLANGLINELNQRVKAVQSFGKTLKVEDAKLLDELVIENRSFTKEFLTTMRGGKKSAVFAPTKEQVKDEVSTKAFIDTQNISTATVLKESSKLGNGLFDTIMAKNKAYNDILAKGLDKAPVEDVRNLLFDIRLKCGQWLDNHKDAEKGSKQEIQANQIKELQPLINKHIAIIGGLAINKDNFLEIQAQYKKEIANVQKLEKLIGGNIPKGMTSEEYQIRIDNLKAQIKKGIVDCRKLSDDWLSKHKDGSFGTKKKDNTLNDLAKTLSMRAYKILGDEIPPNKYTPAKPYSQAEDKALAEIEKMVASSKGKQDSTKYEERFKKLGDLNNAIQSWEFQHKYYEGKAIEQAKKVIEVATTFLSTEYDVINAQMSMKGLEAGYGERLTKYKEWVLAYNSNKNVDPKEHNKNFPKLIEGSNALIEFIDTWKGQYKKLLDSNVPIPSETATRLKVLEKEFDGTKKIIENSNFYVLTGMADLSLETKAGDMNKEALAKESDLVDKKKVQADLTKKINDLHIEITKLKLDIENAATSDDEDKFRDSLDKKEEELEKLKEEFADMEGVLEAIQTKIDNLKLQAKQFSERLEKQKKGDATVIYLSVVKEYEDGKTNKSFDFEVDLDLATETSKRNYINHIIELIREWNKKVVDPSLEYLEPYVRTLNSIQVDLELQLKQLNQKKAFVDTNYENIVKSYDAIVKAEKAGDLSVEALQELSFCRKLIGYWFKENPVETDRNKAQRKRLTEIRVYVVAQIESPRFVSLQDEDAAISAKENLENLLKENKEALQKRMSAFSSEEIYNANIPDIGKELLETEKATNSLFRKSSGSITKEVDALMTAKKFKEAIIKIAEIENHFVAEYKKLQVKLHEALVEKEQRIFVSVGETNFDYETSGQFSPEEIDLMNKTLENITERATAILRAGGTAEEAEKMFEHIPVALWPDKFISELEAFRSVEKALEEEARGGASSEIADDHEALGIKSLLKDVGKGGAEGLKNLADKFSEINGMFWHDELNSGKDGYDTVSISGAKQSDGFKQFVNGVDLASIGIDLGLSTIDFVGKTKEQVANLKMERAQAFLFEGKVKFNEDGTGEFEKDPAKNTVAQKKRVIILMGMKFAAETTQKITKAISGTSDAHGGDGGKVLTAVTKDISAVFGALALAIDLATDDDLPRTTQEAWDKNFDKVTRIAQGLLSVGVTVAETVKIFQVIPMEVLPGLGIASGAVSLIVDVYGIAKNVIKLAKTQELLEDAQIHDRRYVGPLEQELTSIKRKIAKQAVDTAADALALSGGIAVVSGAGAPAGAAISLVAGIMKLGNSIVFQAINEAQMKTARDLLVKARAGDREAQMEIMAQSPVYAKMFIAIGATNEPPDPIALEFVRQRGLTERDINDEKTSKWVIRKFVRTKLLDSSEETDDHKGKIGEVKGLIERIEKWYARSQRKDGFWTGTLDQSFKLLTELYSLKQLEKMVLDFTKNIEKLNEAESKSVKKFKAIYTAFETEYQVVELALSETSENLTSTVEEDKKSKGKDFSIQIQKFEREKEGLAAQKVALENILDIVKAVKHLVA